MFKQVSVWIVECGHCGDKLDGADIGGHTVYDKYSDAIDEARNADWEMEEGTDEVICPHCVDERDKK